MVTLFIDQSLNMPLGKLCAQASHGVMKLFLDRFEHRDGTLIADSQGDLNWLKKWIENDLNFEIKYLPSFDKNSPEFNQKGAYSHIFDHGRTCFNGQLTHTVTVHTPSLLIEKNRDFNQEVTKSHDEEARQILIIDRSIDYSGLESELIVTSAKASLFNLLQHMENKEGSLSFSLPYNSAVYSWLTGSFAKITLSVKGPKRYEQLAKKVKEGNFPFFQQRSPNLTVLAFGPCTKIKSLHLTKKMQLF